MHALDQFDVARLLRADTPAWPEFVRTAAPLSRAIVRRTLAPAGREADMPDVLHEIFARFCRDDFRLVRAFDPQKGRLSSWLGVIAARTAVDYLRKNRAAPESFETTRAQSALAASASPPTAVDSDLPLPPAVVSPQQELILRLCYEDDFEVAEIAEVLRTESQTVRSQRHKALERLRDYFSARRFF